MILKINSTRGHTGSLLVVIKDRGSTQFAVLEIRKFGSTEKRFEVDQTRTLLCMCGVTRKDEIRNETADEQRMLPKRSRSERVRACDKNRRRAHRGVYSNEENV